MTSFDVIVVGGGPGGYVAAIRAAQLGLNTALVERQHLGGTCLNWGCIPTKALLRGAEVANTLAHAADFGFTTGEIGFDLKRLVKHSRDVSARLSDGIAYLLYKNGVSVVNGHARLTGKGRLSIETEARVVDYRADHVILATGARPKTLSGIEPDGTLVWSYIEAMVPETLPKSLLVIGSGAIGVEFSSLYNDLGVDVVLVELLDQVLPSEDTDVSAFVRQQFECRGIRIKTSTRVTAVDKAGSSVTCTLQGSDGRKERVKVDRVILSAGIQGNIEHIGLEALGVETDGSFIRTDAWLRTNVAGIYALGDVAGPPCLAHKASHEGVICVEKLAGVLDTYPMDKTGIPACTFCRPQIASVGMTESQAKAAGRHVNIGRFNLQANGKALAIGEASGFVKTVFDRLSGELLGAHMVGPEVTEQIYGFILARSLEATEGDLARAVFPHPTLSEAIHESVLDAMERALHQ